MVTLQRLVWSVRATPARAGCPEMLRRVRAPRPPVLGHGEQFAGCRPLAFRIGQRAQQADVAGGTHPAREFTHRDVLRGPSPMRGMHEAAPHIPSGSSGAKTCGSATTAAASDANVAARIRGIPSAVRSADATCSGRGKTWVSPSVFGRCLPAPRRSASRASLQGRLRRPP